MSTAQYSTDQSNGFESGRDHDRNLELDCTGRLAYTLGTGFRDESRISMPDLLVNLLKLPSPALALDEFTDRELHIRRAQPFEITLVRSFIKEHFSVSWADEISVGFASKPVSVYIAVSGKEIIGFAAYECTRRAFFGPAGVAENARGRGVGKALLLACLHGLREMGYVYGVIGHAGPIEFYQKTVGAIVIPDSDPGIYTNLLP